MSAHEGATKIRVFASHGITDGRCIFDYMELFTCVATNEQLPQVLVDGKDQEVLPAFGRRDLFTEEVTKNSQVPESWNRLIKIKLNPPVELPSHVVNDKWEFEYPPVKAFCEKHHVTLQGIVSAAQARAIWKYHNGELDSMELGVFTPVDSRRLKYTCSKHKATILHNNVSIVMPFIQKKETILEQIHQYQDELNRCLNSTEPVDSLLAISSMLDEKTHAIKQLPTCPDNSHENIIFASHLGRVPNREKIEFGSVSPVIEWGYWPNIYAFHNDKMIGVVFVRPFNVDQRYVDAIHDSFVEIMDFIKDN